MKELTRHIESLLLDNDCVILPQFGGFVTNHVPARWIEEENLYLPPYRTIGFNPQLKINDGLLVQSYMLTHDATFPEATRLVEAAIDSLSEELYKEGLVKLHGIGTLRRTIIGEYQFDSTEDGVITPAFYGLGSVGIKPLALFEKEQEAQTIADVVRTEEENSPVIENKNRTITIKIRHEWITNAVAVAAAIFLFFFLSTPVGNTYIEEENYASLGNIRVFEQVQKESMLTTLMTAPNTADTPVQKVTEKSVVKKSEAKPKETVSKEEESMIKTHSTPSSKPVNPITKETTTPQTTPAQVSQPVSAKIVEAKPAPAKVASVTSSPKTPVYNVIIASVPAESDAQPTIQDLAAKGYPGAFLVKGGGRFRIALKAHKTEAEAYSQVNELKQNGVFKDAWVLKTRK